MNGDLLFSGIDIIDENFTVKKDMFLGVADGKICYLSDKAPDERFARTVDGKNRIAMPALYNTHTHLPMVLLRGYAENLALADWLNSRVFPFEGQLTADDVYHATLLAQAEMLRFGCVSSTEMYFFLPMLFKATEESGAKMNGSNAIICFGNEDFESFKEYGEYTECLNSAEIAKSDRFILDMAIHAEYTSNPVAVEKAAAFAKAHGLRMQLHLSETKSEHEECKQRHGGLTPAAYFEKHGAFDVPCTAAHCVYLEGDDFDILARNGVTVANNPISNLKLASGFANIKQMLAAGINVSLGTDGAASNNNLNLFEELKLYATLNKALSGDPTLITPSQALYAATRAGALSQGRDDCGLIKEGFAADITVLDTDKPYYEPEHDMLSNIVYSAQGSDVVMTLCNGKVLYENGEYNTIDVEKARREVRRRAKNIADRLGG